MKRSTISRREKTRIFPTCYPRAYREAVVQNRRAAINIIRESDKILGFVTRIERVDTPKDSNE